MTYESDVLRNWYLLFHFGSPEEIVKGVGFEISGLPEGCFDFPVATVEFLKLQGEVERALDIGCAVGRSTFELSRNAREVVGIDFSASFVAVAEELRKREVPVVYRRYSEMHLWDELTATLPEGILPDRVSFEQGDAMDLRSDLGVFDVVHAANLLCRLPEPVRFLNRLPELVKPGGKLVLATPATWLPEYTPPENQPNGLTLDFLLHYLGSDFELVEAREIPFLIREHERKLQLSTSQTSLWKRRG